MMNFHDDKLWQDAYVCLMDVHGAFDGIASGEHASVVKDIMESATAVAAKIADGLSRIDRRFGRKVLLDAIGLVAVVRTHLAVAWGSGLVSDEAFRELDGTYASLSESLQRAR